MLDRVDIHIEVPRVDYEKLNDDRTGESSDRIVNHLHLPLTREKVRAELYVYLTVFISFHFIQGYVHNLLFCRNT